jgi:nitroreductase
MSSVSRVLSLSRNRQGIGRFADRTVPPEILCRILECARHTTSAKEAQPWRFIVVQDAMTRHRLSAAAFNSPLVRTAPVVIAACARVHTHVSGNGRLSHPVDLSAATQSMVLAAADMGLASVWITGYREGAVRELLGIPADVPVVSLLALGYSDGLVQLPERLAEDEVVSWERWGR